MTRVEQLLQMALNEEDFTGISSLLEESSEDERGEFFRKIYQHMEHIYISGDRLRHSKIKSGIYENLNHREVFNESPSYKKYNCLVPKTEEELEKSKIFFRDNLASIEPNWIALIVGGPIGRDPIWVREIFQNCRPELDGSQVKILQKFLISERVGFWLNDFDRQTEMEKKIEIKENEGKRLKIAIMVSGQMRGFQAAFDTWREIFSGHDLDYFISTWKINGSSGKPDHLVNEQHRFYFGDFSDEISNLLDIEGSINLDAFIGLVKPSNNITKKDLREVYGKNAIIKIEDESELEFLVSNPQKMYYKIESAYSMIEEPEKYDLLIRIRPDIVIQKRKEIGDFLYSVSMLPSKSKAICTGYGYNFAFYGFGIDDKFAVGTPELMGEYCKTWTRSIGNNNSLVGHESLATNLFERGIDCVGSSDIFDYRFSENVKITREIFDEILES